MTTRSMDAKNFDTQRNLSIDFKGTRENMSISRSTGIGSESSLTEFDVCVSCLGMPNVIHFKNCSKLSMADFINPRWDRFKALR